MVRLSRIAAALLVPCLIAAFTASAEAAGFVRQTAYYNGGGSSNQTVVFVSTPHNGNRVTIIDEASSGAGAPASIKDSNGVALTLEKSGFNASTQDIYVYDYTVSGSPTATYSCTIATSGSCNHMFAAEIGGTALDTPSYTASTGVLSIPTSSALTNSPGDVVMCYFLPNSGETISISNATGQVTNGTLVTAATAFATGPSSVCSGNAMQSTWALAMANYPLSPGGCGAYPYPCAFQASYENARP